ncbi:major facilitator superfamily domain-containing protein [Lipomyces arxii]|uniref:major facilitator superfamily domain-containing protein n=1 Tax=Lipomyces arxii TaxID=56418 RepID=UPI0034CD6AAB
MLSDRVKQISIEESNNVQNEKIYSVEYHPEYKPTGVMKHLAKVWDTFGKEPQERKLLLKLDAFLLLYGILAYIVKTLDTSNISNAYVSGMKEDLNIIGNEYNYMTTAFTIGYMAGAIPAQIVMNRVRPSIFIPCCTIFWTAFAMAMAGAKSPTLIYVSRAFIGLAEAGLFPSISWMIGSWYMPSELAKRMITFELANQMAAMFSGYIQAGLYSSMNGVGGLSGWRWLFIIDGVISIPVGIFGVFALPDFPANTRAVYLNQKDRDMALLRVARAGRKPPKKLGWRGFVNIFMSWKMYSFMLAFSTPALNNATGYFNLWLKSLKKYSVEEINIIPTGGNAVSIVYGLFFSWLSDATGLRWQLILVSVLPPLVGCIMLSIWNIEFGAKMAAFFLLYAGSTSQPMTLVWGTEVLQESTEVRGMSVAFADTITNAFIAWLPIVIFPTVKAPHYSVGYQVTAGLIGLQIIGVFNFLAWSKWEQRKRGMVFNEFGLAVLPDDLHVIVGSDEESYYGEIESESVNEKKASTVVRTTEA